MNEYMKAQFDITEIKYILYFNKFVFIIHDLINCPVSEFH